MAEPLILPNNWEPRDYQLPLWEYLDQGGKRAIWIAHRRAGKDDLALHFQACQVMRRVGNYVHMLPAQNQARRAIWNAVNPHSGLRRIHEAFPPAMIARELENEMLIEFVNGSTWQVLGSDNYEGLIGSPPVSLVFSEWATSDPSCWPFLAPILRENDGIALFISTPRGRNHCWEFYDQARKDSDWFSDITPATKTNVFSPEGLAKERSELVKLYGPDQGESLFQQEYECSFSAANHASFFGRLMEQAEREGRITNVPHDPRIPTHTCWDLGISDATVIWMIELVGKEIRLVDYIENSGMPLDWYVRELQKKNFLWGQHIFPHDVAVRELGTGRSRLETLRSLGINGRVVPAQTIADGINALRTLIPAMWFDQTKCAKGIAALREYRRSWDDKRKIYHDRPYHDWTSHAADALRIFAMANVRNTAKREIIYSSKGIV